MTKQKSNKTLENKEINYIATRSKRGTRRPEGPVEPVVQKAKRPRKRPRTRLDNDLRRLLKEHQELHPSTAGRCLLARLTACAEEGRWCWSVLCSECAARQQKKARAEMIERVMSAPGVVRALTVFGQPVGISSGSAPDEIAKKVTDWWNNDVRGLKRALKDKAPGVRFVARLDLRIILRHHVELPPTIDNKRKDKANKKHCAFIRTALPDWDRYDAVLAPHFHGFMILPPRIGIRRIRKLLRDRYRIARQVFLPELDKDQSHEVAVESWSSYCTEFAPVAYEKKGAYFGRESRVLDGEHLLVIDAIQRRLSLNRWGTSFGFRAGRVGGVVTADPLEPLSPLKIGVDCFVHLHLGSSSLVLTEDGTSEVVHRAGGSNLLRGSSPCDNADAKKNQPQPQHHPEGMPYECSPGAGIFGRVGRDMSARRHHPERSLHSATRRTRRRRELVVGTPGGRTRLLPAVGAWAPTGTRKNQWPPLGRGGHWSVDMIGLGKGQGQSC